MSELKPCPFCGGEAEIIKSHGQKIDTRTMPYRVALAVACKNMECGANMGNWYERAEAVAAWNRRAQHANSHVVRRCPKSGPLCCSDKMRPKSNAPLSNADRIRTMSDDELADFLGGMSGDKCGGVARMMLDWLRQPEEEGTND